MKVLSKTKIAVMRDSIENSLLSFLYDEVNKKRARYMHGTGLPLYT